MTHGRQPEWELFELTLEDDDSFSVEGDFDEPETVEYWCWNCPACGLEEISDTYFPPARRTQCPRCGREF